MKNMKWFVFLLYVTAGFSQDLVINEFVSSNKTSLFDGDGDSPDWVELYNSSSDPINLSGYFLSDDLNAPSKWTFPSVTIQSNDFILVFASGKDKVANELHTNFKIKAEGEHLLLFNSNKELIDSIPPVKLGEDESYGRDGISNKLTHLVIPTPGDSNTVGVVKNEILFSLPAGFYSLPIYVTLSSNDSVYYTLDGSEPSLKSPLCEGQISIPISGINKFSMIPTTFLQYDPDVWPNREFGFRSPPGGEVSKGIVLRVQSYKNGLPSSEIITKTYFDQEQHFSFPVFSLVTDSLSLFDYDTGLYVSGVHLDSTDINWTGNYYMRGKNWERRANLEFFDSSGTLQFSEALGVRISGNKSRHCPQKSIRLYFRDEYGKSEITYPFFPSRNHQTFKRLTLRSSFTFWWGKNSLFADDLIHRIVSNGGVDMEIQKSQASLVFINGEYWGIQNTRERQDKHYLKALFKVDKDSVDIIAGNMSVSEGSAQSFIDLMDFVASNDMKDPDHYQRVKDQIDVENYIDYYVIELYFDNQDWPGNNMKMWKSQAVDSKWRWFLYDLDAAFSDYNKNSFESINENQSDQAKFFKKLLENKEFKAQFIARFIHHLHHTFDPTATKGYLMALQDQHIGRWGIPIDYNAWDNAINFLGDYLDYRPCVMEGFLIDNFKLDSSTAGLICRDPSNTDKTTPNFTVYPNPSSGNVFIRTNTAWIQKNNFKIIDATGKMVHQGSLCCRESELEISFLKRGVYFLGLSFDTHYVYKKVVIQK